LILNMFKMVDPRISRPFENVLIRDCLMKKIFENIIFISLRVY